MKGKNEQKAKWSGSVTEKRREAKRQKIDKNLKAGLTVEIIPARSELEPEKVKTVRVAACNAHQRPFLYRVAPLRL